MGADRRHRPDPGRAPPGAREDPPELRDAAARGPPLSARCGGRPRASRLDGSADRRDPAHPAAHAGAPQEGAPPDGRGVGPALPPRPRGHARRGDPGQPGEGHPPGCTPRTGRSEARRRCPSSTPTSAPNRWRPCSCAWPTASSARRAGIAACASGVSAEGARGLRRRRRAAGRRPLEPARHGGRLRLREPVARRPGASGRTAIRPSCPPTSSRSRPSSRTPCASSPSTTRDLPRDWRRYPAPEALAERRHRLGARRSQRRALRSLRPRAARTQLPPEPGARGLPRDPAGKPEPFSLDARLRVSGAAALRPRDQSRHYWRASAAGCTRRAPCARCGAGSARGVRRGRPLPRRARFARRRTTSRTRRSTARFHRA